MSTLGDHKPSDLDFDQFHSMSTFSRSLQAHSRIFKPRQNKSFGRKLRRIGLSNNRRHLTDGPGRKGKELTDNGCRASRFRKHCATGTGPVQILCKAFIKWFGFVSVDDCVAGAGLTALPSVPSTSGFDHAFDLDTEALDGR